MKKVLYIIIPIIVLLTIMLIIIFLPKEKEELKKINNISHFSFYYSQGYAINSDIKYYIDCEESCIAKIKPYGIDDEDIKEVEVDNDFINKVIDVFDKYEVIKWDGFDRYDKDVLDGNSFSFNLTTNDGTNIHASGYMEWPDNYKEVREELNNLFNSLI